MSVPQLHWMDWALLALLLASVAMGLVRGVAFELMALVGWVVAWFGAQYLARELTGRLTLGSVGPAGNMALSFTFCFVVVLLAWSLLARLVRLLIQATPLSVPDRLLGALFGLARGGVLLLALAIVVTLTPAAESTAWRESQGGRWLGGLLVTLKPLLPDELALHLPN